MRNINDDNCVEAVCNMLSKHLVLPRTINTRPVTFYQMASAVSQMGGRISYYQGGLINFMPTGLYNRMRLGESRRLKTKERLWTSVALLRNGGYRYGIVLHSTAPTFYDVAETWRHEVVILGGDEKGTEYTFDTMTGEGYELSVNGDELIRVVSSRSDALALLAVYEGAGL